MRALAFKITEVEENPSLVEGATKECSSCDPDSPLAVPRNKCKACGGSGREPLAILEIVKELRESVAEGQTSHDGTDEDSSLYLEG